MEEAGCILRRHCLEARIGSVRASRGVFDDDLPPAAAAIGLVRGPVEYVKRKEARANTTKKKAWGKVRVRCKVGDAVIWHAFMLERERFKGIDE